MEEISLILNYSFKALKKNWKALIIYALVFLIAVPLSLFHITSIFSNIVVQLISTQLMVYYSTPFYTGLSSNEELLSFLENSSVAKIFKERVETSAGIFLASFIISMLLTLMIIGIGITVGISFKEDELTRELLKLFVSFSAVLILISWFIYVYPLALGYAMEKEGFGEAFLAMFKLFSPSLWKKALSFEYFKLITLGGLILIALLLLGVIFLVSLILTPLGIGILYLTTVFMGSLSAVCYLKTFKCEQPSQS